MLTNFLVLGLIPAPLYFSYVQRCISGVSEFVNKDDLIDNHQENQYNQSVSEIKDISNEPD